MLVTKRPKFSRSEAAATAARLFGIDATADPLPSERDQNFKLTGPGGRLYVLKIAHPDEREEVLGFENAVLERLGRTADAAVFPRVLPTTDGQTLSQLRGEDGVRYFVRLLSFLPGSLLAGVTSPPAALLHDLGFKLGRMDAALADMRHPAMVRFLQWDAAHAPVVIRENLERIPGGPRRSLVEHYLSGFERRAAPRLPDLRRGVIHNDVNDHNVLVACDKVSGVVDFGDALYGYTVSELAIACAYVMLGKDDPLGAASDVVHGYCRAHPLTDSETGVLADFIFLRLCLSVCIGAKQQAQEPDNPYLSVSQRPAWLTLERFKDAEVQGVTRCLTAKLPSGRSGAGPGCPPARSADELLALRREWLAPNLSLSYREPLKIVRGAGQYLYDADGRAYLDCVNNVCHVGHCHPRVVAAGRRQMEVLNTNTRYLHDNVVEYALRLTETLPAPLRVCFFVNSGSEANELALRLARTHTGRGDVIVVDHGYHGNTQATIDVSPYKFNRKGGRGKPDTTHVAPLPDHYRGRYKGDDPQAGAKYAGEVALLVEGLRAAGRGVAAFLVESLPSCAGQIVLPDGYLTAAYSAVRAAGGVCVADEVQVGFGRVGSHAWGFQTQGVVPDVVTFGKPAGNGHPLAGVVTTPEIAASFANGMEYFNTFGGNPVSCAAGLEVLNVLRDERLQEHARDVGAYLIRQLRELRARHPLVGDVRGLGLFVGVELVRDRATLDPATVEAGDLVDRLRRRRILLSTDGPFDNVI